MNQKKAKAIRRVVRNLGHVKAELPKHHKNMRGHLVEGFRALFPVVVTARYPNESFQRIFRVAKRAMRDLSLYVLRERADLYAYVLAERTAA